MFQAKFRVLSITEERDHRVRFALKPVTPNSPAMSWSTEEKSDENACFWNATPSGEAELWAKPEEAAAMREQYPVGRAVFIDFEPAAEVDAESWGLSSLQVYTSQVSIQLHPLASGVGGKLMMGVHLKSTCIKLLDALVPSLRACYLTEEPVPQAWSVRFIPTAG